MPIASYATITSTFAETSPHVGIYNVAFDIWANGIAVPGCNEIMLWTENFNQVPGGSYVQDVPLGGRTYAAYKTASSGYIAFIPDAIFTSGTVDLLEIMNWMISQGWLAPGSTWTASSTAGSSSVSAISPRPPMAIPTVTAPRMEKS